MGGVLGYFPYNITGTDPLAEANSQFIEHCRQLANQGHPQYDGAQNVYRAPQPKPIYGKCAYCKTLFHEQGKECRACGAPR